MVFLFLFSVHLFQEVPVINISLSSKIPTISFIVLIADRFICYKGGDVLNEGLLILGRSLDGRGGRLGLATTTSSETNTAEESTENAHGELYIVK